MKKKSLVIVATIILTLLTFSLTACKKDLTKIYPDWAFDGLRQEDASFAEGANVRVMSANVLVHISGWGGTPVQQRAEMFSALLQHYSPHVVGLQEYCEDWNTMLPQLNSDYKLLNTTRQDYTTMIYNTKTVNLLEQGILRYSKESNKNCRFVVWGLFELKESQKRFVVTSTHWDFGMESKKVQMRTTQANELSSLIKELAEKYSATVFATGDYNVLRDSKNDGSESYDYFLKTSGCTDSKNVAEQLKIGTTFKENNAWDYIFTYNNPKILKFEALANRFFDDISDHSFIYVDSKI